MTSPSVKRVREVNQKASEAYEAALQRPRPAGWHYKALLQHWSTIRDEVAKLKLPNKERLDACQAEAEWEFYKAQRYLIEQSKETAAVARDAEVLPPQLPPPRLTVDLAKKTITLDGNPYDVDSENALRWVKVLAEHAGDWISSTGLKKHDSELDGCRPDRLKKHLPDAVLDLIESDTGKGSRMCV